MNWSFSEIIKIIQLLYWKCQKRYNYDLRHRNKRQKIFLFSKKRNNKLLRVIILRTLKQQYQIKL